MAAPAPDDDTALALHAADGDHAAFTELVRRYGARLDCLLRRTCGLPPQAAEDVAQETWLKVWNALPAWQPGHFRGWLFAVARNTARDHNEKAGRRTAAPLAAAAGVPARGDTAAAAAESAERAAQLDKCRDRLPADFRTAFDGYVGGESDEQQAAAAAVQPETIRSRRCKARALLRKCMGIADS